jgi:hypothetical protein
MFTESVYLQLPPGAKEISYDEAKKHIDTPDLIISFPHTLNIGPNKRMAVYAAGKPTNTGGVTFNTPAMFKFRKSQSPEALRLGNVDFEDSDGHQLRLKEADLDGRYKMVKFYILSKNTGGYRKSLKRAHKKRRRTSRK